MLFYLSINPAFPGFMFIKSAVIAVFKQVLQGRDII